METHKNDSDDDNNTEKRSKISEQKTDRNCEKTMLDELMEAHENLKKEHQRCLEEIKSLKEVVELSKETNKSVVTTQSLDDKAVHDDQKSDEESILYAGKQSGFTRIGPHIQSQKKTRKSFNCGFCKQIFPSSETLGKHREEDHTNDGDWRCDDCPYQTNEKANLTEHMNVTHHSSHQVPSKQNLEPVKCNLCGNKFETSSDMSDHKKKYHKSFKPCKNLPDCSFKENCLFNHNEIDQNNFLCYVCGDEFNKLSELMVHRKTHHSTNKCQKFLKDICNFTSEKCWYSHETKSDDDKEPGETITKEQTILPENMSVFRVAPDNLAPPSNQTQLSQATWIKLTSMMTDLKQMMEKLEQFQ